MPQDDVRYQLAPGLEIVPLGEQRYLLRSEFVSAELSGETAVELVERVLAALEEPLGIAEIVARMPGYDPESLERQLDGLVEEGVLQTAGPAAGPGSPFGMLLDEIGLGAAATFERLAALKVAVFGLEGPGAHLARMLADAGIGALRLVDPFPFEEAHRRLTPVAAATAVGRRRQEAVASALRGSGSELETAGPEGLDRERVVELATGCDLLVACWDRGFAAAQHWVNRAALELGIPALFGELGAVASFAGPLVLPHRSACWMCYRMRSLACEQDFERAMALEEHLDRQRRPRLGERPVLPPLPAQLGAALALETLKLFTRLSQPGLVDGVEEYDAVTSESRLHPVLVKPDCPVCAKKKARRSPGLDGLLSDDRGGGDPAALVNRLVSPRTGLVSDLVAARKDPSEPVRPLVWRALLANHRFYAERSEQHAMTSGKGMDRTTAVRSCLGEAVERYSSGVWSHDELTVVRRDELEGPSLDPAELVLYRDDQYPELPYAPYAADSRLAWMPARSLTGGHEVWVPAIAVLMDYPVESPEEFLFPITSNGLAAGPTPAAAVAGAVEEVIERDAFLIAWMHRLAGISYEAAEHPDPEVRQIALAYRRRGVRIALVELPVGDPLSVFVGLALQEEGEGPAAVVGLGAKLDPVAAGRQAALEVAQVRPALRQRVRGPDAERMAELFADPAEVATLDDHALLYAHPETATEFDFLFGERGEWPRNGSGADEAADLARLVEQLRAAGQEALYVNLTSPELEPLGLFAARAILPGYQPIWFGRRERRLGGERLLSLPHRLGLTAAAARVEELNPMPHPIA